MESFDSFKRSRQNFYPELNPTVSSTLMIKFTYVQPENSKHLCDLNVTLVDTEPLYNVHLKGEVLLQDAQLNGKWGYTGKGMETNITTSLSDQPNTINITVTGDSYFVTLNDQDIEPKFTVDWSRLLAFKRLEITNTSNCFRVDLVDSFLLVKNISKFSNKSLIGSISHLV